MYGHGNRHNNRRRDSLYDEELDRGQGHYFKHGKMYIPEGSHRENMEKYKREHVGYHQKRMNRYDPDSQEYRYHKEE